MTEQAGKPFDAKALAECDGTAGKPSCIAVDGVVYDVSASRLWKGGLHMKRHRAGGDLSADLAAAPHGREVLEKVVRAGVLKTEPAAGMPMPDWLAGLLEQVPFLRRHPHPMVVHFPIVCMYSAAFFVLLGMLTGEKSFEATSFYCLAGGILFMAPSMLTGWFSWWLNYMAKPMRPVTVKKRLSWLLLTVSAAAFAWRFAEPAVADTAGTGRSVYLVLVLSVVPLVSVIGYLGGELTFPTGKGHRP